MRATAVFAMAALALAAAQAANAAEELAQVRAEFTGLSYQLNDLTPGDATGPTFSNFVSIYRPDLFRDNTATATFGVQGLSSSGTQITDSVIDSTKALDRTGSFFTPLSMNASLLSGEASAVRAASGATANVTLDNSRFADGFTYGELNNATYGGPVVQARVASGPSIWILGAGTELSFTATITLGVSVNAGALLGLTQGETLRVLGAADVHMGFTPQASETPQDIDFAEGVIQQSLSIEQDVGPGGVISTGVETSQQKTFTLTGVIRNRGTADVTLEGNWHVNALTRVSPVPEPSTWVLIAAGLGIVPLARRRRVA